MKKSFKYLKLYQNSDDHLTVVSTDTAILKELLQAFKERPHGLAPQGKSRENYDIHWMRFTHLKNDTTKTYWWLLSTLCETGWEPFAVFPGSRSIYDTNTIHLRKEVTT